MVKNGENINSLCFHDVKDQIGKPLNHCAADLPVNESIRVRKGGDVFKPLFYGEQE